MLDIMDIFIYFFYFCSLYLPGALVGVGIIKFDRWDG